MYKQSEITIKKASITSSAISDIELIIDSGPVSSTFTPFTNSLGISGDTKLEIAYNLYYDFNSSEWNSVSGVVRSFSGTTIEVSTADYSLASPIKMKVRLVIKYILIGESLFPKAAILLL